LLNFKEKEGGGLFKKRERRNRNQWERSVIQNLHGRDLKRGESNKGVMEGGSQINERPGVWCSRASWGEL